MAIGDFLYLLLLRMKECLQAADDVVSDDNLAALGGDEAEPVNEEDADGDE